MMSQGTCEEHVRIKKMTIPGTVSFLLCPFQNHCVMSLADKLDCIQFSIEFFFSGSEMLSLFCKKGIFYELKSDVATMASKKGEREGQNTKELRRHDMSFSSNIASIYSRTLFSIS